MVTADGFRAGLLYGEPGRRQDLARPRGPDPAPARPRHRRARVRGPRRAGAELRGGPVGVRHPAQRGRAAGRVHRARGVERGAGPAVRVRRRRRRSRVRRRARRSASSPSCSRRSSAARPAARASCSSARASGCSVLGALERRTGSLFPPSQPLRAAADPGAGREPRSSIACCRSRASPRIPRSPMRSCRGSRAATGLLAADLQIAAMAMRDLRITTPAALQAAGGPTELERAWLHAACAATGNERSGAAAVRRARAAARTARATGRRRDPRGSTSTRATRSRRSACSSSAA